MDDIYQDFEKWSSLKLDMCFTFENIKGLVKRPWNGTLREIMGSANFDNTLFNILENIIHELKIGRLKSILEKIPKGAKFLDFGAGCGQDLFYFEEHGYRNLWYWDRGTLIKSFFEYRRNKRRSSIRILPSPPTLDDKFDYIYQHGLVTNKHYKDNLKDFEIVSDNAQYNILGEVKNGSRV